VTQPAAPPPQIQVDRLSFTPRLFRTTKLSRQEQILAQPILRDLSFEVRQGDRILLTGPSGAGKTTLLRLFNRLHEPTQGHLTWNGTPYEQISPVQLRQQMVLLHQETKLLGMTVQAALDYPLRLRGLDSKARQQRVSEWLERLNIPAAWLNRSEAQLSLGQRQWVAIARALLTQPQLVLLDEPTTALDLEQQQRLQTILLEYLTQTDTTVIVASHQLEWAQPLATHLLYLNAGELKQNQPIKQVQWANLHHRLQADAMAEAEEWMRTED
jgi:D-methionine transport system ATP-binding protein